MAKLSVVLVGVGAYGVGYAKMLLQHKDTSDFVFKAAADPFAEQSAAYEMLTSAGISIYKSLDDFFAADSADLVIVSTPISLHYDNCITAIRNGAHVLCEKPLVPKLQQVYELNEFAASHNKLLAVGFQLSFSDIVLKIKEAAMSGKYGKPLRFKTYVSWPRARAYYEKGWTGKTFDAEGRLIMDSIAMNATAHYIHNMLFLLGGAMDSADEIDYADVGVYRANDIDSYDTITFRGQTLSGCELMLFASHATNYIVSKPILNPILVYEFERAVISVNMFDQTNQCVIHYKNGDIEYLGDPTADSFFKKFEYMLDVMRSAGQGGGLRLPCTPLTVIPHLKFITAVHNGVKVAEFPKALINESDEMVYVKYLHIDLYNCFQNWKLPSEMGCEWSVKETRVNVKEI